MLRTILVASLIAMGGLAASAQAAGGERFSPAQKQAWCDANPEKCAEMKNRHDEMQRKCAADPQACEEKRAELQDRRDEWKKKCDANPAACEEKKAQMRDRIKERMQDRRS